MTFLRNIPVFLWWVFCLIILMKFPVLVCVLALMFLLAMPFKKVFLPNVPSTEDIEPMLGITKYSALQHMTAISMVKAYIYANRGKTAVVTPVTKMLDISKGEVQ